MTLKNKTVPTTIRNLTIASAAAFAFSSATAGDYGKAIVNDKMPIESAASVCDLFDLSTLYEGDTFVKEIALTGRYHGQFISASEDFGAAKNGYHEYDHRRTRLGIDLEFQNDLKLVTSINVSDGSGGAGNHGLTRGVFFDDWDEFYLEWAPEKEFYVIVGKQKQKITRENAESSKRIITFERSQITNEVISDKPWGVAVGFEAFGLNHEIGGYVLGADLDSTGERYAWADFDSRGGLTYRTSVDITENTEGFFDYQFTNNGGGAAVAGGSADLSLGSNYEHVIALGTESEWGEFGLITDVIFAGNRNATGLVPAGNDTYGLVLMPYYNLTDKLQLVGRYAYMDEGREQRTQRFNVRQAVDGYHTFYAGFNYRICGDKLKLMAGYEYATGDEFGTGVNIDSSTWLAGIRTYW